MTRTAACAFTSKAAAREQLAARGPDKVLSRHPMVCPLVLSADTCMKAGQWQYSTPPAKCAHQLSIQLTMLAGMSVSDVLSRICAPACCFCAAAAATLIRPGPSSTTTTTTGAMPSAATGGDGSAGGGSAGGAPPAASRPADKFTSAASGGFAGGASDFGGGGGGLLSTVLGLLFSTASGRLGFARGISLCKVVGTHDAADGMQHPGTLNTRYSNTVPYYMYAVCWSLIMPAYVRPASSPSWSPGRPGEPAAAAEPRRRTARGGCKIATPLCNATCTTDLHRRDPNVANETCMPSARVFKKNRGHGRADRGFRL